MSGIVRREKLFVMQGIQKRDSIYLYTAILNLCKQRGMSIAELERRAGLGNGVIRKWDTTSPTMRTLVAVADCLGVTLDDLIGLRKQSAEKT